MKFLYTLLLSLPLTGCAHESNSSVVVCTDPTNNPELTLRFHTEDSEVWHGDGYNVYLITTVDGKQIAINSFELNKYTCGS
ncbi:hypothetical protein Xoosp13_159 [Xanthomonas phage Xoo-sp13]|nr:hypothetical protein Xoosp13_159 [Xanthomonas phage Xoo-sp13]